MPENRSVPAPEARPTALEKPEGHRYLQTSRQHSAAGRGEEPCDGGALVGPCSRLGAAGVAAGNRSPSEGREAGHVKDQVSSSAWAGVTSGGNFSQEPRLWHLRRSFGDPSDVSFPLPPTPSRSLAHLKGQTVVLRFKTDNQLFVNSAFPSGAEDNFKMRTPIHGTLPETEPSPTVLNAVTENGARGMTESICALPARSTAFGWCISTCLEWHLAAEASRRYVDEQQLLLTHQARDRTGPGANQR